MPDIILTTPRSRMKEAALEAEHVQSKPDARYFRRFPLSRIPDIIEGERVYYVEDGYVRGFAVVDWREDYSGGYTCATTGRQYPAGTYLFMRADSWKWIVPIRMGGFQGYRYAIKAGVPRESVEIIGGWRDPKPEAGITAVPA